MTRSCTSHNAHVAIVMGLVLGCDNGDHFSRPVIAKAGIFYGGQLQNRKEWPLILDATRQTQGFRIDFAQPLPKPARVHWEVIRSSVRQKKHSSELGGADPDAVVAAGSQRFDQVIAFSDSDRPGDWRLKVTVDGSSVLDEVIHVIPRPVATPDD